MLLVLAGCNQAFGLKPTGLIDAPSSTVGDAAPDGPPVCPTMPPMEVNSNAQILAGAQGCAWYSESRAANLAMIECNGAILAAPIGGTFSPLVIMPPAGSPTLIAPRLSADGQLLTVKAVNNVLAMSKFALYRSTAGTWTQVQVTLPDASGAAQLSVMAVGSEHRMLYADGQGLLEELIDDGSLTWAAIQSVDHTAVASPSDPYLSPDGLRAVYSGYPGSVGFTIVFATRAGVGDPFGLVLPITNAAPAGGAFLTDDCGRLYFDLNNDISYATR